MEKRGKRKIVMGIIVLLIIISVISLFVSFVKAQGASDKEDDGFLNAITEFFSFNWLFQESRSLYSTMGDTQNAYYGTCVIDSDCSQPVPSSIRSCGGNKILETKKSNICKDGICVETAPLVSVIEDCSKLDDRCKKGVCDSSIQCIVKEITTCSHDDSCCPTGCVFNGDGGKNEDNDCGIKCDNSPQGMYCDNGKSRYLADIDNDGIVGLSDWGLLRANNGKDCPVPEDCNGADIDRDGDVDEGDFEILKKYFGKVGEGSCIIDLKVCDDGNNCTVDSCGFDKRCRNDEKEGDCTTVCLNDNQCPAPSKRYICNGDILNIGDEVFKCNLEDKKCIPEITYKEKDCSLDGKICKIGDDGVGICDDINIIVIEGCGDGVCDFLDGEDCYMCSDDCGECVSIDEEVIIEQAPEPNIFEKVSNFIIDVVSFAFLIPIGHTDSDISANDISDISLTYLVENAENLVEVTMYSGPGDGMITALRFVFSTTSNNCIVERDINDDPLYPEEEKSYLVDISSCENDIIGVEKIEAIKWEGLVAEAAQGIIEDNNWCDGADINKDGKVWLSEWGVLRANFGNVEGTCNKDNNWCDGADFTGAEDGGPDGKVWLQEWGILRNYFGNTERCYGFSNNCFNINDNPIQICTCNDLQRMNEKLDGNFELMNDVDCEETKLWDSKKGFLPIGTSGEPFTGNFNGKNYYISYLNINRPYTNEVGLFGVIKDANIKNIHVAEADVNGGVSVGILAGYTMTMGTFIQGEIKNSHSSGVVKGNGNVGGLIGFNSYNEIRNSYSEANVIGKNDNIGGLVGKSHSGIINSYSSGKVEGKSNVGGLVGYHYNQETETENNIENSFSISDIICESECGAIAGAVGGSGRASIIETYFYNDNFECSGTEINGDMSCIQVDESEYFYDFYNYPMSLWGFSPWSDILDGYYFPSLCTADAMWTEYCGDNIDNDCDMEVDESDCIYEIYDCYELQDMNLDLNGNYELMNNIDCSDTEFWNEGEGFIPIGNSVDGMFEGSFSGNGFEIYDLYINRQAENSVGLFGELSGEVYDINMINVAITGNINTGALVGNNLGTISKVFSSGTINGNYNVGGLVGENIGTIKNSAARMNVITTGHDAGGFVGVNAKDGVISDCYSRSEVNSDSYEIGGFCGKNSGKILNSYSNSEIVGSSVVSGFIGYNTAEGNVENCFSSSDITGEGDYGGFIGKNNGIVINSFYNKLPDNPLTCGSSICTIINNQKSYFYDLNNEPMASWGYPPWGKDYDTFYFPTLIGIDDKECVEGAVKNCDTGYLGECSLGYSTCSNGVWGSCMMNNNPATEYCSDEIDNDCDGVIDELDDCSIAIETCENLQNIGDAVNKDILLLNDIDCSQSYKWNNGKGFLPISLTNSIFNGRGYEISGLYINRPDENNIGLFSRVESSIIDFVGIVNADITGKSKVGILAGEFEGYIHKVYTGGEISGNSPIPKEILLFELDENPDMYNDPDEVENYLGLNSGCEGADFTGPMGVPDGKVWMDDWGILRNYAKDEENYCNIGNDHCKGADFTGPQGIPDGKVWIEEGQLLIKYFKNQENFCNRVISQDSNYFGGLVGNFKGGEIKNSFSILDIVDILDSNYIGGLVGGSALSSDSIKIVNSYSAGKITSIVGLYIGGLVGGSETSLTIKNSFADNEIISFEENNIGGLVGLSESNMLIENSYWNNRTGSPNKCYSNGNEGCYAVDDNSFYFIGFDNIIFKNNWDFYIDWKRSQTYPYLRRYDEIEVDPLSCYQDIDCPSESIKKRCKDDNIWQSKLSYSCIQGRCVENIEDTLLDNCISLELVCEDGLGLINCEDCVKQTFYRDYDNDGFGDSEKIKRSCYTPLLYADNSDDCFDYDSNTNPNAKEICNDNIDNDCNPETVDDCEGLLTAKPNIFNKKSLSGKVVEEENDDKGVLASVVGGIIDFFSDIFGAASEATYSEDNGEEGYYGYGCDNLNCGLCQAKSCDELFEIKMESKRAGYPSGNHIVREFADEDEKEEETYYEMFTVTNPYEYSIKYKLDLWEDFVDKIKYDGESIYFYKYYPDTQGGGDIPSTSTQGELEGEVFGKIDEDKHKLIFDPKPDKSPVQMTINEYLVDEKEPYKVTVKYADENNQAERTKKIRKADKTGDIIFKTPINPYPGESKLHIQYDDCKKISATLYPTGGDDAEDPYDNMIGEEIRLKQGEYVKVECEIDLPSIKEIDKDDDEKIILNLAKIVIIKISSDGYAYQSEDEVSAEVELNRYWTYEPKTNDNPKTEEPYDETSTREEIFEDVLVDLISFKEYTHAGQDKCIDISGSHFDDNGESDIDDMNGCTLEDQCVDGTPKGHLRECGDCQVCLEIPPALHFEVIEADSSDIKDKFDLDYIEGKKSDSYIGIIQLTNPTAVNMKYEVRPYPDPDENLGYTIISQQGGPVILGPKGSETDKGSIMYKINLDKDTPKDKILGLDDFEIRITPVDEDGSALDDEVFEGRALKDNIIVEIMKISEIVEYDDFGKPLVRNNRNGNIIYSYDDFGKPNLENYDDYLIKGRSFCTSDLSADGQVCTLKNPAVNIRFVGINKEEYIESSSNIDSVNKRNAEIMDLLFPENSCGENNQECCYPRGDEGLCKKGYCSEEACPPSSPGVTDEYKFEEEVCGKCQNCNIPGLCGKDEETEGKACCNKEETDSSCSTCGDGEPKPFSNCPTGDCPNIESSSCAVGDCSCGSGSICARETVEVSGLCSLVKQETGEEEARFIQEVFSEKLSATMAYIQELENSLDKSPGEVEARFKELKSDIENKEGAYEGYAWENNAEKKEYLYRINLDLVKIYEMKALGMISNSYLKRTGGYIDLNIVIREDPGLFFEGKSIYWPLKITLKTQVDLDGIERVKEYEHRFYEDSSFTKFYNPNPDNPLNLQGKTAHGDIKDLNYYTMLEYGEIPALSKPTISTAEFRDNQKRRYDDYNKKLAFLLEKIKVTLMNDDYKVDRTSEFYRIFKNFNSDSAAWKTVQDRVHDDVLDTPSFQDILGELEKIRNEIKDSSEENDKVLYELITNNRARIFNQIGNINREYDEYYYLIIRDRFSSVQAKSDTFWARSNLELKKSKENGDKCKIYLVSALNDAQIGLSLTDSENPDANKLALKLSKNLKNNIIEKLKSALGGQQDSTKEVIKIKSGNPGLGMWCPIQNIDEMSKQAEEENNEIQKIINYVIVPYQMVLTETDMDLNSFYKKDDSEKINILRGLGISESELETFGCLENKAYCISDFSLLIANGRYDESKKIMKKAGCKNLEKAKNYFKLCTGEDYQFKVKLDETFFGPLLNEFNALNGIILVATVGAGTVAKAGISSYQVGSQAYKSAVLFSGSRIAGVRLGMRVMYYSQIARFASINIIAQELSANFVAKSLGQKVYTIVAGGVKFLVHASKELAVGVGKYMVIEKIIEKVLVVSGFNEQEAQQYAHIAAIPLATLRLKGTISDNFFKVSPSMDEIGAGLVFDEATGELTGIYKVLSKKDYWEAILEIRRMYGGTTEDAILRTRGKLGGVKIDFANTPAEGPLKTGLGKKLKIKDLYIVEEGIGEINIKGKMIFAGNSAKVLGEFTRMRAPGKTGSGPGCFLADTKIMMADGSYKNIQDISKGEMVKAYDLENNMPVDSEVTKTFVRDEYDYRVIEYEVI